MKEFIKNNKFPFILFIAYLLLIYIATIFTVDADFEIKVLFVLSLVAFFSFYLLKKTPSNSQGNKSNSSKLIGMLGLIVSILAIIGTASLIIDPLLKDHDINKSKGKSTTFYRPVDPSWKYENNLLRTTCFTEVWASGDNYEFYHEHYGGNSAYPDFVRNIGKYMGAKIPFEAVTADWGDKVSLAAELTKCSIPYSSPGKPIKLDESNSTTTIEITDEVVRGNSCSDAGDCESNWYTVLRNIPLEACGLLAPHFKDGCIDIRLVQYAPAFRGGSSPASIYGIIKDQLSKRIYMVPLANFYTANDALNYVDRLLADLSTQASARANIAKSVEPLEDCSAWTSQTFAKEFIQENLIIEESPEKITEKMMYFKKRADQIPNNCLMDFTDSVQFENDRSTILSLDQKCNVIGSLIALLNASKINYIRTIRDHDCLYGITFQPPQSELHPYYMEPFWIDNKWVWRNRITGELLSYPDQKECQYPQPFGWPCVGDKPAIPYAKGKVFIKNKNTNKHTSNTSKDGKRDVPEDDEVIKEIRSLFSKWQPIIKKEQENEFKNSITLYRFGYSKDAFWSLSEDGGDLLNHMVVFIKNEMGYFLKWEETGIGDSHLVGENYYNSKGELYFVFRQLDTFKGLNPEYWAPDGRITPLGESDANIPMLIPVTAELRLYFDHNGKIIRELESVYDRNNKKTNRGYINGGRIRDNWSYPFRFDELEFYELLKESPKREDKQTYPKIIQDENGGYKVTLRVFKTKVLAEKFKAKLLKQGLTPNVEQRGDQWELFIGPYPSEESANQAKSSAEQGDVDAKNELSLALAESKEARDSFERGSAKKEIPNKLIEFRKPKESIEIHSNHFASCTKGKVNSFEFKDLIFYSVNAPLPCLLSPLSITEPKLKSKTGGKFNRGITEKELVTLDSSNKDVLLVYKSLFEGIQYDGPMIASKESLIRFGVSGKVIIFTAPTTYDAGAIYIDQISSEHIIVKVGMSTHSRNYLISTTSLKAEYLSDGFIEMVDREKLIFKAYGRKSYFIGGGAFWYNAIIDRNGKIMDIDNEDLDPNSPKNCYSKSDFLKKADIGLPESARDIICVYR